ncbi:ParA family protein [Pseudomonas sp. Irchel s3f10]|uniref:ParA family protein n=1 Tax=Pseudomonas sp. Irchel s3f10 TaxID=2009137 RepID=UPI000BA35C31|nr:AAA family ATPase [Pseudomonas sp. Irchel s3f10]
MRAVIAQHKGGVGKTTLAVHIAGLISSRFKRTLLIDCDSQGDAFHFFTKKFPSEELTVETGMDHVDVTWNPNRKQFSNKGAFSEYANIVVDVDTRVTNALQVIVEAEPTLILIPIDNQQLSHVHGLQVLKMIESLESKFSVPSRKVFVAMGVNRNDLSLDGHTQFNIPYHNEFDRCLNESQYIWDISADLKYITGCFREILA